jgi:peptide/nickel transport system permease protein
MLGISLPVFLVGALLLYYLTDRVQLFPPGTYVGLTDDPWEWLTHMILPWFTLSILFVGFYSRVLRSNVLDTMNEDHVRTALAKGLPRRQVLTRHVLRNALVPIVTLLGLDFGAAIGGGAILTEKVFSLQGVGQYAADSVGSLDLPPIMGTTLYAAFFIVLLSAMVDIAYARLDPRIRLHA